MVRKSLLMACDDNKTTKETIFHSDQDSEYTSKEYRMVLEQLGLRISMSWKGHCWDNAHMESFIHTPKTEIVYFQRFRHLAEAIAYNMDYIQFYNGERLHSGLGYRKPNQAAAMAV